MNQAIVDTWSDSEQAIARSAFQKAYERAVAQLAAAVQAQASALSTVESIWALHDFLSIERHTMEGRFDFRLEGNHCFNNNWNIANYKGHKRW
jgi:hypothetical protein